MCFGDDLTVEMADRRTRVVRAVPTAPAEDPAEQSLEIASKRALREHGLPRFGRSGRGLTHPAVDQHKNHDEYRQRDGELERTKED